MSAMIKVATIAGSDASGGAGLEADLKTFEEYGLYGMAAITLVATMDPNNNWAHNVFPLTEDALRAQLETVFKGVGGTDGNGISAAKAGMLGSFFAVELTKTYITGYRIKNFVLDPVMVCKGAGEPLNPGLNNAIAEQLLPLAEVVTPNLFEAGELSGIKDIDNAEKVKEAARIIAGKGARYVFIKAPRIRGATRALDYFFDGKHFETLDGELYATNWTHGAGCTVSAAICAGLARSLSAPEAVQRAKRFISASLRAGFPLNQWVGPGNPAAWRSGNFFA